MVKIPESERTLTAEFWDKVRPYGDLEMTGNGLEIYHYKNDSIMLRVDRLAPGEAEKLEIEYGVKLPETWETDKYGNKIEKVEDIYHIYDDGTQET